jgi:hypothetical protein
MNVDGGLWLLLLAGPAGATALYWVLYQYYRNTDNSHGFERETKVEAKPVTESTSDRKVDEIKGTSKMRIDGENVAAYRQRVRRIRGGAS